MCRQHRVKGPVLRVLLCLCFLFVPVVYDDVPTIVHASEQKYIKSEVRNFNSSRHGRRETRSDRGFVLWVGEGGGQRPLGVWGEGQRDSGVGLNLLPIAAGQLHVAAAWREQDCLRQQLSSAIGSRCMVYGSVAVHADWCIEHLPLAGGQTVHRGADVCTREHVRT